MSTATFIGTSREPERGGERSIQIGIPTSQRHEILQELQEAVAFVGEAENIRVKDENVSKPMGEEMHYYRLQVLSGNLRELEQDDIQQLVREINQHIGKLR